MNISDCLILLLCWNSTLSSSIFNHYNSSILQFSSSMIHLSWDMIFISQIHHILADWSYPEWFYPDWLILRYNLHLMNLLYSHCCLLLSAGSDLYINIPLVLILLPVDSPLMGIPSINNHNTASSSQSTVLLYCCQSLVLLSLIIHESYCLRVLFADTL